MSYEPELGQMLFGNPTGAFEVSDLGRAAVLEIVNQLDRLYWNKNQKQWDRIDDPAIDGITYRPYWWGGAEAPEAELPNLTVRGHDVEVRWYKHPGRGLSVHRDMTPQDWHEWMEAAMRCVRESEKDRY